MNISKKTIKLIIITFISVICMGLSLSILNFVDFGCDPFTFMNLNVAEQLSISLGTWQLILNIILFIPVIIFGRKYIGIGTIINMLCVGYSIDFFTWFFKIIKFDTLFTHLWVRIIFLIPSILFFAFAAATYISTDLGTSPYDAIPAIIADRVNKISYKFIRIIYDALYIFIGYILCGNVKIATILIALFLGYIISFVKNKFFSQKIKNF